MVTTLRASLIAVAATLLLLTGCTSSTPTAPAPTSAPTTPADAPVVEFTGDPCWAYEQEFELTKTTTAFTQQWANGDSYESSATVAGKLYFSEVFAACADPNMTVGTRWVTIDIGIKTPNADANRAEATISIDGQVIEPIRTEANEDDDRVSDNYASYRTLTFALPSTPAAATLTVTLELKDATGAYKGQAKPTVDVVIPFEMPVALGADTTKPAASSSGEDDRDY